MERDLQKSFAGTEAFFVKAGAGLHRCRGSLSTNFVPERRRSAPFIVNRTVECTGAGEDSRHPILMSADKSQASRGGILGYLQRTQEVGRRWIFRGPARIWPKALRRRWRPPADPGQVFFTWLPNGSVSKVVLRHRGLPTLLPLRRLKMPKLSSRSVPLKKIVTAMGIAVNQQAE